MQGSPVRVRASASSESAAVTWLLSGAERKTSLGERVCVLGGAGGWAMERATAPLPAWPREAREGPPCGKPRLRRLLSTTEMLSLRSWKAYELARCYLSAEPSSRRDSFEIDLCPALPR